MHRPPAPRRWSRPGLTHLAALAVALGVGPTAASAQATPSTQPSDVARAREHFDVGSSLYRVGRFVEAAHEFELAYALSAEPLLLHNIYLAYRDAGEIERAATALRRYLEVATSLSDDDRAVLTRRLAALDQTVARERAQTEAAETAAREAEAARERAEAEAARIAAEAEARRAEQAQQAGTTDAAAASSRSPVPLVLLGVGGGLLLTGGVTGGLALAERGDLETRCAPGCTDDQIATMRTLGLVTDVSIGLGAASAVVGLVLLVTGGDDADDTAAPQAFVVPSVGPGRAGLSLVGRF